MLQVPSRFVRPLAKLRELTDEQFVELVAALSKVPLSIDRDDLTDQSAKLIGFLDSQQVGEIVDMLVSLKGAQEQIEPTADFADAFIDAIARSEKSELAMRDGEEKERFKTRILSLLT